MSDKIKLTNLVEFIDIAEENNIDFAKITYCCGAHSFVDYEVDFGPEGTTYHYRFKNHIFDCFDSKYFPYYVMSIKNKAYIMYELQKAITVWVCYTEEDHRNSGLITSLLNNLLEMYPGKNIEMDTYSESLRKVCNDLGIPIMKK
jgi:hypothetical protein